MARGAAARAQGAVGEELPVLQDDRPQGEYLN
jgi:hypothetical protein